MNQKVASGINKDLRVRFFILIGCILCIALFTPVSAETYTVCLSGCNFTGIQEAINFASDGDTIEISSGQYNEPVIVNRSLTLKGVDTGGGFPVIDASGEEYGVTIGSPDTTLFRLHITGANNSAVLVQSDRARLCELIIVHEKVEPEELTYPALTGEDISGLEISACTFEGPQDTVVLYDPGNYSVTYNTFLNPKGSSVAIISSSKTDPVLNGIISGNTIIQEGGSGIAIVAGSSTGLVNNLTIADNTISGAGGSIGLFIPSGDVVIRNNTLQENPEYSGKGIYGIMTYGTSGVVIEDNHVIETDVELAYRFESCSGLTVTGNTVDSNSDTGMGFIGVTDSVVSGNTMNNNVYNFWMSSVVLEPGLVPGNQIDQTNLVDGKPVLYVEGVDDLTVDGSDETGMIILYACDNAVIQDMSFTANGAGIIAIRSDNATITNCTLQQLYNGVFTVASHNLIIRDNHITDCFEGLAIGDFHDGDISNNIIENSGDCGILTSFFLEDVVISNNRINDAIAGICLERVSGFNNAIFLENTIENTMIAGISSDNSEGALIIRNYLDPANGVGFEISSSSFLNVTGNTLGGEAEDSFLLYDSSDNSITSNTLTSTGSGFIMKRMEGRTGSQNNLIINNLVNSPVEVQFCIGGGSGDETSGSKFGICPITPEAEIPLISLESGDDPDDPDDFDCQPDLTPPPNTWNVTKTSGTNIVGGPYLGGNYWATPDGTGWSQVTPDRGDGFCNAPFVHDSNNTDYLPLHLYEGEIPITAPAVINRPGRYILMNDLVNSTAETAISIKCSDVSLNGDGHTLGGSDQWESVGVGAGGEDEVYMNITIQNLTVTGWQFGFACEEVERTGIYDCQATGNLQGVAVASSSYCTIERCIIRDNVPWEEDGLWIGGNGMSFINSTGIYVLDSIISHNGWGDELPYVGGSGILALGNTGLCIYGCVIEENVNTAIWNDNSKNTVLTGNHFNKNGGNGGIFMTSPPDDPEMNCTIEGNTITGSEWGIWLMREDYRVRDNTVTGCQYGILLDNARNATLSGNVMSDNTMNFGVDGVETEHYFHQVDTTNTVDGKPIYYLVEENDVVVDNATGAGVVYVVACEDILVKDLVIKNNEYGLFILGSDDVRAMNVTATKNADGIGVSKSANVYIGECSALENANNGFLIRESERVLVVGVDALLNAAGTGGSGISVEKCVVVLLYKVNSSQNNFAGIDLEDTMEVFIAGSTMDSNRAAGAILGGNTIYVTGCTIRDNEGPGIGMLDLVNVTIWDNYFSNEMNLDLPPGKVKGIWNQEKTAETNIVDGPFIGGNYWANPDGTGWSQVTPDRGDGFCNAPYVIDADNVDALPLHIRNAPPFYADFEGYPREGYAPLTVYFNDISSGEPFRWYYRFGDGSTSSAQNPVHTYRYPGTYTVTLSIMKMENSKIYTTVTEKTGYITVTGAPGSELLAQFNARPVTGEAPLTVSFTDYSMGNPAGYRYSFGDLAVSTSPNPVHTYSRPGTYSVQLTVWSTAGGRLQSNTTVCKDCIMVT